MVTKGELKVVKQYNNNIKTLCIIPFILTDFNNFNFHTILV